MSLPVSVSFGGGVQSTAIALLVEQGKLPAPASWVFADTGDEPAEVYEHVEKWSKRIDLKVVVGTKTGSLLQDYIEGVDAGENPPQPPLWIADPDKPGARMPMRRQCTERYKIRVIKRYLRERFDIKSGKGPQVVQWIGISVDEAHRMKPAGAGWYSIAWPLIDLGMRRTDCLKLLADAGESAPRSACRYCPYHGNDEWKRLKSNPDEWARIVADERAIHAAYERNGGMISGQSTKPTLHRSGIPIDEIDFDAQPSLFHWGNECAGVCGV
tara:strand:- start:107 stop:916 length:810 start_codon:yes stop_codon:yes gene_type:complete